MSTTNPLVAQMLGIILHGPARPKGKPPSIEAQMARVMRVARRAPEVVVKVRVGGRSPGHVRAHMRYITRRGTLDAENERGDKLRGLEDMEQAAREWGFQMGHADTRRRAQTVNIVLSMPAGTDPRAVLDASRGFAKKEFAANHQYVFVLHTDTDKPHVHLSVKAQGYDLTWLKRSKEDLQRWRECFAQQMRDQGVEAEATPRRARGQMHRGASQAIRHKPAHALLAQSSAPGTAAAVGEERGSSHAWLIAQQRRQRVIRDAYEALAEVLEKEATSNATRDAGHTLKMFAAPLPDAGVSRPPPHVHARQSGEGLQSNPMLASGGPVAGVERG